MACLLKLQSPCPDGENSKIFKFIFIDVISICVIEMLEIIQMLHET